jgi:Trk K+ transport system NAD-binding subunit
LDEPRTSPAQPILICGLGRLGQHCAVLLKELGIPVFGLTDVELVPEVEAMANLFDRLTVGDCRRHSALEAAGIDACRAVLLTTSDERVNVSAALAARALNPEVRLVVRSSQTNLNDLLHQSLANLIALDVAELPATAIALAAIGDETVGLFSVDGQMLRVVENRISTSHRWHRCVELHDLNTLGRRVLHRTAASDPQPIDFHGWDPGENLSAGDVVVCIELNEPSLHPEHAAAGKRTLERVPRFSWSAVRSRITRAWTATRQTYRLAVVVSGALLLLHITGLILYRMHYPEVSLFDAFNVATVLIFDGYSNMFAQLKLPFPIPLWLLLFSLLMTMSGAVVMGILYAYLTARVLSARLNFRRRHGRIPDANHMVVIGMGLLGRRVAELLDSLGHSVVCIAEKELDAGVLPNVPVLTSDPRQGLQKVNCRTAASVAVLTDDDIANLEIALMAARMNEDCNLVIRTDDAEFGRNVSALAPHTKTISVYALAAEAYAAATLGEKVLSLLRIGHQTVIAVEYAVEAGDRLEGKLIADATYGYGLVAILYQRNPLVKAQFFPSEDIRLEVGSRLVVLATMGGLQNVERGESAERDFRVRILRAVSHDTEFEAARIIALVTGCELGAARTQLSDPPTTLKLGLFRQQASRLVRELRVAGVEAEVLSAKNA